MVVISNIYGNTMKQVDCARTLILGFNGQLKGWWDNSLTPLEQNAILDSIKEDDDGIPILDENGNQISVAVTSLIYTILLHFVGDPNWYTERNTEILQNLKCRKLQDFKWYKDVFLTKIYEREDPNNYYWKEKFISGLPKLFAKKVREQIKSINGNIETMPYGEIINQINLTGLQICNDLKLKSQLKKQNIVSRKELGSWCELMRQYSNVSFGPF